MKLAFQPAKINYGAYSDKLGHLHLHLVPKYVDGPDYGSTFRMMPEPRVLLVRRRLRRLAARIKAASSRIPGRLRCPRTGQELTAADRC